MFSIIYHLTGISILEICFFFYYIGPIETEMFKHNINLLAQDSIYLLNTESNPYLLHNISALVRRPFTNNNDNNFTTDFLTEACADSNNGEIQRDELNQELFMKTIKYWSILCIFSLILGIIHYRYIQQQKLLKNKGAITIIMNDFIETEDIQSYRKYSIDEHSDDSLLPYDSQYTSVNKKWKRLNFIMYYIIFGGVIVTFQFLFFQYIIYYYNPLSINETKYLIYQKLISDMPVSS